ncbi:MAG: FecCD family ABC transporter permease [Thermoleophilia bacterium]
MTPPAAVVASVPVPAGAGLAAHRAARRRRGVAVVGGLAALALALFVATMMLGSYRLGAWDVVAATLGIGGDPSVEFVVRELRLPTAVTGLAAGLALGVAGVVFQRLLANPLASPDFVGVSSGASVAAVAAITLYGASSAGISVAALAGAFLTCLLVYLLAWRDGVSGYRFVLIGIGIAEFMYAICGVLIARAEMFDARAATAWLVGSVGYAGQGQLRALLAACAALLPLALVLARPLRALELGDDAASALGVGVERCRLALIGVAIALVAFATAAVGPILFVALMAGPIAARVLGPARGLLAAAGLVGAVIVLSADLVAVHALPVVLPTGVVTGAIGAPYLIWLLATANRAGRGG